MYTKQHLVFVLNLLLNPLKLHWINTLGLQYRCPLAYGEINFIVTKNFAEVIEFLGLDPKYYEASRPVYTIEDLIRVILNSRYTYLPSVFAKQSNFDISMQQFHAKLVALTKEALNCTEAGASKFKFTPLKNRDQYYYHVDRRFKKQGKLVKFVNDLEFHNIALKRTFIGHKFNGNLIIDWVPELKPGKNLREVLISFRAHIEKNTQQYFAIYVKNTCIKSIRSSFVFWYNKEIKKIVNSSDLLPY